MFLSNDDFYQLRRITLSDLLDNQSSLVLTNLVSVEAKKALYSKLFGSEPPASKKRRLKDLDSDGEDEEEDQTLGKFKHDDKFAGMFTSDSDSLKFIDVS